MSMYRVLVASALAFTFAMASGTGTAHAASCVYMAHNQFGQYVDGTHAKARAFKKSTACRRARRRCNRRLERKIRNRTIKVSTRGVKCGRIKNL